ncbi:hypothetical protein HMPREF0971_01278 [Segatella oris F0302]|uniref:DUF7833 domain-containing protein n=1 Tax=Segatella oris F0302 TaxID=649760 RepID=D1QQM7_9BACT|nr:Lin1244/Lin1753 domain-containing protein [Segatella oris]EFB32433.1 hypothetical protein HMPREF0971_01278 [Segatella oris F0302]
MENQRMQKGNMAARNNRAMQSSEVFIRLDISMLNSYDMMLVREKYGIEGWGVVVFIMKYLIERRTDCRAPLYAVNEIARICHKRKNSVLQLIMEFPSLFEIEANGKIFFSPYLLQFFGNSSANEKQINHSLDKLTNETLDNQEVSIPKNKNKEQEQITTKEKKRKETSPNPRGTSPSPSQGGECDADGKRLREIGTSPSPSQGGECVADGKRLREIGASPDPRGTSPDPSQGGECVDDGKNLRREESITAIHSATSCGTKQRKTQKTEVRHRNEQTATAPPTQAEMGVTRELLSQLYQDNEYMTSLERIANLAVRTNFAVRRNLLFWFQYYCQSHAKRVKDIADAKDYLANLMRPGSNTRAYFMAYQNRIYERNYQMKMQSQRNEQQNAGRINAGCCQS